MSTYNRRAVIISRNIYRISGVYGILILVPQLFRESAFAGGSQLGHPEFFYGFFLVSVAFQILFLIISTNPLKYRDAMLAGFLEKGGHFISCLLLFLQKRISAEMLIASSPDGLMLCLFIYSYLIIKPGSIRKPSNFNHKFLKSLHHQQEPVKQKSQSELSGKNAGLLSDFTE